MKHYTVTVHIITPLIIHTGEYYSIFELLPTKDNKSIQLIDLNKAFNIMNPNEREQFLSIMDTLSADIKKDKEKLLRARSIIQNVTIENPDVILHKVQTHPQFIQGVDTNPYAVINKIFKDELSMKPFIPGSTLKGALRTAILESLRKKDNKYPNENLIDKRNRPKKFQTTDFEMQIMKNNKNAIFDIEEDPFRFIKVSDCVIDKPTVLFDTIRVIGKNQQQKGIPIYTEMTGSYYTDKTEFIATGEITIDDEGLNHFVKKSNFGNFINIDFILNSIKDFNTALLNNKKHIVPKEIKDTIEQVCEKHSFIPLRLGRFTQIESKTFKINRKDKDAKPQDINIVGGVSRSLIQGKIPAGWCGIKIQLNNFK